MEYVLTIGSLCLLRVITSCIPPMRINETYVDAYSCMLDGYTKSYDKIIELKQR